MANRIVFVENGFFHQFRESVSTVSADLLTHHSVQFDADLLTELMRQMDSYYSAGDNGRALACANGGLALLSKCDLRLPETKRERDRNRLTLEALTCLLEKWDKAA